MKCARIDSLFQRSNWCSVFNKQDPAVSKFLHTFAKENEALKLVAGSLESSLFDASDIGSSGIIAFTRSYCLLNYVVVSRLQFQN